MVQNKRPGFLIGGLVIALVAIVLVVGGTVALLSKVSHGQSTTSSTNAQASVGVDPGTPLHGIPAPDFTLTNQFGNQVSLSQFRGKAVILAFTDSECTNVCPLTSQSLLETLHLLGPAGSQVQLLGVNANPTATSQQVIQTYSIAHGMENRWFFLTGSTDQLEQVWKDYHIYAQLVQGAIDHTPGVYVIDPQGREQTLFLTSPQYGVVPAEAQQIAQAVAQVLPGHVQISKTPVSIVNTVTTTKPTDLPLLTAQGQQGKLTLGPGQAHLTFFFASWSDNIAQELAMLNQEAASLKGVRTVAVDIGTTEPSATSAQHTLQQVPGQLTIPVAIDQTGNVADAYGVQDVPWYTLTTASGKVLWTHGGWLAPSDLSAAVQKALAG